MVKMVNRGESGGGRKRRERGREGLGKKGESKENIVRRIGEDGKGYNKMKKGEITENDRG